jgi:hypothetical protein
MFLKGVYAQEQANARSDQGESQENTRYGTHEKMFNIARNPTHHLCPKFSQLMSPMFHIFYFMSCYFQPLDLP